MGGVDSIVAVGVPWIGSAPARLAFLPPHALLIRAEPALPGVSFGDTDIGESLCDPNRCPGMEPPRCPGVNACSSSLQSTSHRHLRIPHPIVHAQTPSPAEESWESRVSDRTPFSSSKSNADRLCAKSVA